MWPYFPHKLVTFFCEYVRIFAQNNFVFECYIIKECFFILIFFVNYILSFNLAGLWTIRVS